MQVRDVGPARKLVAELLGTWLLAAAVLGSGIMAASLAKDPAVALLCNTLATGGALVALILMFGPVSGAHLNPMVTACLVATREVSPRLAVGYVVVQLAGGIAGAITANVMFALAPLQIATTARTGFGIWFAEAIAMFGLVGVVIAVGRTRPAAGPFAVAAYIVGGYWFTSSTSFVNPAVTIARVFTDTYGGVRPGDLPGFLIAEAIGAALGLLVFTWLVPPPRDAAA